jgi:hypothetical protein
MAAIKPGKPKTNIQNGTWRFRVAIPGPRVA